MKSRLVAALAFASLTAAALVAYAASATLSNQDSKSYKLLIADSDSCFSGTHTSIGGNTTTTVGVGWLCLDEKKPGFKLENGKTYVIKDGKVSAK